MKSLRDQLLKAGLTDKQSVKNVRKQKQKQPKAAKAVRNEASESAKLAMEAQQQKTQRDKELNRQRQQEAEKKAQLAQIKQLVEGSKIDREGAEIAYNFSFANKVKTIYVTAEQQQQLMRNQIAIVTLSAEQFDLVPRKVAEKIIQRNADCVIENGPTQSEGSSPAGDSTADDPYADYQIPDDLMW